MLKVSNLRAGYGDMLAFVGINLEIMDGEIAAVLGRNGAGKTTLMRAMMGLIKVKEGQVQLAGQDITNFPTHKRVRKGIAYVPQGRHIFPRMSVMDNLKLSAIRYSDRTSELLAKFPILKSRIQALGWSLSGGQQQVLAVDRAFVSKPCLLLMDEPTEGIQPSIIDQIGDELRRMNQEEKVTILLTEQNLDFAMRLVTRALLTQGGVIAREPTAEQLMKDKDIQVEYLGV